MSVRCAILLKIVWVATACASGAGPPSDVTFEVSVWNRSQFDLLEVRPHYETQSDAQNILQGLLPVGERVLLQRMSAGHLHITAIREQVQDGPLLALTTSRPLSLRADGWIIMVFDQSFRFVSPSQTELADPLPSPLYIWSPRPPPDGALLDGGPADDGAPPGDPSGTSGDPLLQGDV